MSETYKGGPEFENVEKHSQEFIDFQTSIETGVGEINCEILTRNYEQEVISKDELVDLALQLLRKFEVSSKDDRIDSLTGIANRKGFNEMLDKSINELRFIPENKRENPLYSIMIINFDMNDLRILNNTYGHNAGDAGLKVLAECLKDSVRENDTIARIGGDEFLVMIPVYNYTEEDIYEKIFERFQNATSNLSIDIQHNDGNIANHKIVVALGYAVMDKSNTEMTSNELLHEADTAMYATKNRMKSSNNYRDFS